jgi:hypothetical protein
LLRDRPFLIRCQHSEHLTDRIGWAVS